MDMLLKLSHTQLTCTMSGGAHIEFSFSNEIGPMIKFRCLTPTVNTCCLTQRFIFIELDLLVFKRIAVVVVVFFVFGDFERCERCRLSHSLFELLRSEARVMEGLRSLQIETHHIHNILKLNVHPSDTDYAVDIRNPAISVSRLHPGAVGPPAGITNAKILLKSPSQIHTRPPPISRQRVRALNLVSLLASSGSTTWRRTASTARGRTTCRSCCGPPSPESSGKSAKTSTTWCVQSPALWTRRARRLCV